MLTDPFTTFKLFKYMALKNFNKRYHLLTVAASTSLPVPSHACSRFQIVVGERPGANTMRTPSTAIAFPPQNNSSMEVMMRVRPPCLWFAGRDPWQLPALRRERSIDASEPLNFAVNMTADD